MRKHGKTFNISNHYVYFNYLNEGEADIGAKHQGEHQGMSCVEFVLQTSIEMIAMVPRDLTTALLGDNIHKLQRFLGLFSIRKKQKKLLFPSPFEKCCFKKMMLESENSPLINLA